ncbi:unnamed protein product [Discosporangium mesarthrocarpum]
MFIWERSTGRLVRAVRADEDVLNCVQPHPNLPIIATSGMESVVRLWSPLEDRDRLEERAGTTRGANGEVTEGNGESATRQREEEGEDGLMEIARENQGSMEMGMGNVVVRPIMQTLVMQWAAAGEDASPGRLAECIQA